MRDFLNRVFNSRIFAFILIVFVLVPVYYNFDTILPNLRERFGISDLGVYFFVCIGIGLISKLILEFLKFIFGVKPIKEEAPTNSVPVTKIEVKKEKQRKPSSINKEKNSKYTKLMQMAEELQIQYNNGKYISDKELEKFSELTDMSIAEMRASLEEDKHDKINRGYKNKPKPYEAETQREFEAIDSKYQKMMENPNLSDEELHEICDFYSLEFDDMKAEIEENRKERL
ncbi:hypothetical protein RJI07_00020 [Mycoplasmatota bacterium WC30]